MAQITRSVAPKPLAAKPSAKPLGKRSDAVIVTLPDEPNEVSHNIRDFSLLIHGEKKIGKTSLFAQEEDTLFLMCDPMQKGLSILQIVIEDKIIEDSISQKTGVPYEFTAYNFVDKILTELERDTAKRKGVCKYRNIVIDGVDILYRQVFDGMCKFLNIEHPHDAEDFGKSWGKINGAWAKIVNRLLKLNAHGCAARFICHSEWKEIETRVKGQKMERLVPLLASKAEELLVGCVDANFAYIYDGNKRVLVVKGDERISAGHRIDEHFLTTTGHYVEEIPMGGSPQEAYANLLRAFDNKQTYATMAERAALLQAQAKKKGATTPVK